MGKPSERKEGIKETSDLERYPGRIWARGKPPSQMPPPLMPACHVDIAVRVLADLFPVQHLANVLEKRS